MDSSESNKPIENIANIYESDDQLVVALDFGTTYSGIAYAFTNGSKPEVISIMDWPGLEAFSQPKVPTVICYDLTDNSFFTWGGQKHKQDVVQGVKLLLDPDQPRPLYLPESTAKSDLKKLGKPVVEVAADFIGAIYKHAMARIESKIPTDYLAMCQKKFVLTVPAVWSDKAKDTTLHAAKMAGIHPIELIKEPEAAAMYTLHMLQDRALAIGDAFVVCDAGGGTVDLISYEITRLMPQLELKELVPGKGGMAGSLGLNKRFEEAVKTLVGEDQYVTLRKTKGFEQAVQQFDRSVKTAFRGDPEEDYLINFPMAKLVDDPANNLVSNCWNVKGDDIKSIFDPLISDIERMVEDQVNSVKIKRMQENHPKAAQIKAIFLVGGFGSSEYLKARLQENHEDIQVIQPHGAWGAIAKGAALSQLPHEASIVSTQATRHYGVSALTLWQAGKHDAQPKVWDASEARDKVLKNTWYIYRGEDLKREQRVTFPFYRTLSDGYTDKDLIFEDELIQSENKSAPVYPSATSTKVNCTLRSDLTGVNRTSFKKRTGHDLKVYYDVFYDLVLTMQAAVMRFSLEIQGTEMGSVTATYD